MSKTVRIYNFDTKKTTTIPAAELGPGMVQADMTGIGRVWTDVAKVQYNRVYQHPPVSEEILDLLRRLKASLDEVHPLTLREWEDGFRRDVNAEREIAIWLHIAETYRRCTHGRDLTPEERQDYFHVITKCSLSPREHVLEVVQLSAITREQAARAIEMFYSKSGGQAV